MDQPSEDKFISLESANSDFAQWRDNFQDSVRALQRSLVPIEQSLRMPLWALAATTNDILATANLLSKAFDEARTHQLKVNAKMAEIGSQMSKTRDEIPEVLLTNEQYQSVTVLYKAFFFYVRAHQDACARVLLEILGGKSGIKTSMSTCLSNDKNPVALTISKSLPGYEGWFRKMREIRNQFKIGVTQGFISTTDSRGERYYINMHVLRVTGDNCVMEIAEELSHEQLSEALRWCTQLSKVIKQVAEEKVSNSQTMTGP